MTGILGQVQVSPRDVCGSRAYRYNTARERLVKAGRPASSLTLDDLEVEAQRWENRHAAQAQEREAEQHSAAERRKAFLASLRKSAPGDVIGPDENGCWWQLTVADDLVEVVAP